MSNYTAEYSEIFARNVKRSGNGIVVFGEFIDTSHACGYCLEAFLTDHGYISDEDIRELSVKTKARIQKRLAKKHNGMC